MNVLLFKFDLIQNPQTKVSLALQLMFDPQVSIKAK